MIRKSVARCYKWLFFLLPGAFLPSCTTNMRDAALDGVASAVKGGVEGTLTALIPLPELISAYWQAALGG